ncbi:MAG: hypothetical protein DRQ39_06985 [Gammaproteobacteria bacterium]|nr:MAG: hypothetical protein DRQ39_06985 [Gammaproteobacteria bacterium]
MTTALTAASLTNLPSTEVVDLSKYGTETNFLPRLQLVTKGKYVDKGLIAPGHYGVPSGDDEITDLGAAIDLLVLAVRNKALDTSADPPLAVFDQEDEVYIDIVDRASGKDSGCMFGPSFLVFERNTGKFYEFFCGNKSARMEAGNIGQFLPVNDAQAKAFGVEAHGPIQCTLRAKYIERPRYSWHAPQVGKCSTPITNLPELESVVEQINKFINPETNGPELAEGESR